MLKNVEPSVFLAGKSNKWDIKEVEVYSIEIVNDDEYYKLMLN